MRISIEATARVTEFLHAIEKAKEDSEAYMMPYFRGHYLAAAEEAVFIWDGEKPIAYSIVTMNYPNTKGPCIMATYVLPAYRGKGHGKAVFMEALKHLQGRGATRVGAEIETDEGAALLEGLPDDVKRLLDVRDTRNDPDPFPSIEELRARKKDAGQ